MLPFLRPLLPTPDAWSAFLAESYRQRRFSNSGPCVRRLEEELTRKYGGGRRDAVLVSSCTSGLTVTLQALGVRGRVVVPAFSFPATAQAVLAAGCQPAFADVGHESFELDAEGLDRVLRGDPSIGAVIHVRAYGFCRDLDPIARVCRAHGALLVVDAAAALGGGTSGGPPLGQAGEAEVFSLHATKVFGIGEGGLILAPPSLARAIRRCANFGLENGTVVSAGANAKMSELGAAVGLALLREIDTRVEHRRLVAERYESWLGLSERRDAGAIRGTPPWQTFPVRLTRLVDDQSAEALVSAVATRGVEVRRYYAPALHMTPHFAPFAAGRLPVSESLSRQMICLPVYSDMTEGEQQEVIGALAAVLGEPRAWCA
jgi:dTDP-4-amino-4,6-dideoxygalactose transaminase